MENFIKFIFLNLFFLILFKKEDVIQTSDPEKNELFEVKNLIIKFLNPSEENLKYKIFNYIPLLKKYNTLEKQSIILTVELFFNKKEGFNEKNLFLTKNKNEQLFNKNSQIFLEGKSPKIAPEKIIFDKKMSIATTNYLNGKVQITINSVFHLQEKIELESSEIRNLQIFLYLPNSLLKMFDEKLILNKNCFSKYEIEFKNENEISKNFKQENLKTNLINLFKEKPQAKLIDKNLEIKKVEKELHGEVKIEKDNTNRSFSIKKVKDKFLENLKSFNEKRKDINSLKTDNFVKNSLTKKGILKTEKNENNEKIEKKFFETDEGKILLIFCYCFCSFLIIFAIFFFLTREKTKINKKG